MSCQCQSRVEELEREVSELKTALSRLFTRATVTEEIPKKGRVRVADGSGFQSGELEYFQGRHGKNADFNALDKGEQVLLFAPGGDLSQAIAMPGLPSNNSPQISNNQNMRRTNYGDGGYELYDRGNGTKVIEATSAIVLRVGGVNWTLTANGTVQKGGDFVLPNDDVIARGHSLDNHKHPGIVPGNATTGAAIP